MRWYHIGSTLPLGFIVWISDFTDNPFWQMFWIILGVVGLIFQSFCFGLVIRDTFFSNKNRNKKTP